LDSERSLVSLWPISACWRWAILTFNLSLFSCKGSVHFLDNWYHSYIQLCSVKVYFVIMSSNDCCWILIIYPSSRLLISPYPDGWFWFFHHNFLTFYYYSKVLKGYIQYQFNTPTVFLD
jgi:hypothetical protein